MPRISRRARSQGQALEALARDAELGTVRADRQRNIRAVYRVIVRRTDWHSRISRPVIQCGICRSGGDCRAGGRQACLIRAVGICPSTWKVCRAWLEEHGYLGLVRGGRTPWLRPGVLVDADAANEAAIFVLAIPRSKTDPGGRPVALPPRTRPLSPSGRTVVSVPRQSQVQSQAQEPDSARAETHFRDAVARVARIAGRETIAEGSVSRIVRPFLAAGWPWRDLSWALGHDRDGTQHKTSVKHVKWPRAWLAWRLSQWIGPDGLPVASHSHELELEAAERRQARAEQRAADAAAAAAPADPEPHAAAIRAQFGWRRGPSSGGRIR